MLETLETILIDSGVLSMIKFDDSFIGTFKRVRYLKLNIYKSGNVSSVHGKLRQFLTYLSGLKGLYVYRDVSQRNFLDLMKLVEDYLPEIEELNQITFDFGGVCYNAGENIITQNKVFNNVKVLNCIQTEVPFHQFLNHFPGLEHLTLRKLPRSNKVLTGFSNIPSLKSVCVYHEEFGKYAKLIWGRFQKILTRFPNLVALDLSNMYNMQLDDKSSKSLGISEYNLATIQRACPNIAVFNISSSYNLTMASVEFIIRNMASLEILILPSYLRVGSRFNYDALLEIISKSRPKMTSLLGVPCDANKKDYQLPNLKFMSDTNSLQHIMRKNLNDKSERLSEEQTPAKSRKMQPAWESVELYSQDWYDAHGAGYFRHHTTLEHMKLTDPEAMMPYLRSGMIEKGYSSDDDTGPYGYGPDTWCMWDSESDDEYW